METGGGESSETGLVMEEGKQESRNNTSLTPDLTDHRGKQQQDNKLLPCSAAAPVASSHAAGNVTGLV